MASREDKTSEQPDKTRTPDKTRHDRLDAPLVAGLEGESADLSVADADNVDGQTSTRPTTPAP